MVDRGRGTSREEWPVLGDDIRAKTRMGEVMKVILFRAPVEGEEEEDPYIQKLSSGGCTVCSIPVLAFEFVHLEELSSELVSVDAYSGIIFTSRRAVEAVQRAIPNITNWSHLKTKWKEKLAFAVGKTTCALASTLGFVPLGEETGNAKNLSSFILEKMEIGAKPLLYPCGNLKRESLPKLMSDNGQQLNELMVYNTSQSPSLEKAICRYLEQEGLPTTLVYFSPSGVRFTWEILHRHGVPIQQLQVVAIGPSTEEELLKYKVPVYGTAPKPTPESLFKVLFKDS